MLVGWVRMEGDGRSGMMGLRRVVLGCLEMAFLDGSDGWRWDFLRSGRKGAKLGVFDSVF